MLNNVLKFLIVDAAIIEPSLEPYNERLGDVTLTLQQALTADCNAMSVKDIKESFASGVPVLLVRADDPRFTIAPGSEGCPD